MATTVTKRVTSSLTADNTKRVTTSGGGSAFNPWGTSWGSVAWGTSWRVLGSGGSPAIDVTSRVTEAPAADNSKRVTESPLGTNITSSIHHLLLLEGDESGYLLLEGDASDLETDALELEGDATAIGSTITKRVTETVVA